MERIFTGRGVSCNLGSKGNRYVLKLDDIEIEPKIKTKMENPDPDKRERLKDLVRGKKLVVCLK